MSLITLIYWEWHLIQWWLENHLCLVARAASERLGIFTKSWRIFHYILRGFVLPVLEYCPAVWCLVADTNLKLLYHGVSCVHFITGLVFECGVAHCLSVRVFPMLYKIRCNPMDPLYGALPVPYVPVQVTWGDFVAHMIYLCTPSPKNLAVSIYFYSLLSVSAELSFCNGVF